MAAPMAKAGSGETPARKAKAKGTAKKAPARAYERPRGGEARAIADLVPDIGRTAFRKFGFVQSSVVSRWREIVGDRQIGRASCRERVCKYVWISGGPV